MPLITRDTLDKIRILFTKKAEEIGFIIHIVNGHKDHIHILISSPPKLSISKIVKHIKGYSSYKISWLYWQRGYSAFTVDMISFDRVFNYIKNQEYHHMNPSGSVGFKPHATRKSIPKGN